MVQAEITMPERAGIYSGRCEAGSGHHRNRRQRRVLRV